MTAKIEAGLGWYYKKKEYSPRITRIAGEEIPLKGDYWPDDSYWSDGIALHPDKEGYAHLTLAISEWLLSPHIVGRVWVKPNEKTTEVTVWVSNLANKELFKRGMIGGIHKTDSVEVKDQIEATDQMPGMIIYELTKPGATIQIGEDPGTDHFLSIKHFPEEKNG